MNHDDAKKLVKLLAGLFPNQLTQDQARYFADQFRPFDYADVEAAVKAHRAAHEFISTPQLLEGCRAAKKVRDPVIDNANREGSWADVYRRQRRPALDNACDAEVVLRIHRAWWFSSARKQASYREQLEASCRTRLVAAGMTPEAAADWAKAAFEDSPDYFRQCLAELRNAPVSAPRGEPAECPL